MIYPVKRRDWRDLSAPLCTFAVEIGGLAEKAVDISADSGYNERAKEMLV